MYKLLERSVLLHDSKGSSAFNSRALLDHLPSSPIRLGRGLLPDASQLPLGLLQRGELQVVSRIVFATNFPAIIIVSIISDDFSWPTVSSRRAGFICSQTKISDSEPATTLSRSLPTRSSSRRSRWRAPASSVCTSLISLIRFSMFLIAPNLLDSYANDFIHS